VTPLIERKPATLIEDLYPLRAAARINRGARGWLSARVVTDLVIIAYGAAVALLGALLHPLVEVDANGEIERSPDPMIGSFVAAVFILLCILIANIDLRDLQTFGRSLRKILACFAGALVVFVLLAVATRAPWSAEAGRVLLWLVLGSVLLTALHTLASRFVRTSPAIRRLAARHVAVVCGHQRTCARFLDLLRSQTDAEIRLVGVYHDTSARRRAPPAKPGRSLDDLLEHARAGRIDEVFLALPWHAERRICALVDRLAHLPVDLKLCPDRVGYAHAMVIGESLAGVPVATLHRQPIRDWGRIAKRAIDVGLSLVLLFLLAPLLAGIALAIRLDSPGPALFRQLRQGFNHDSFVLLKFRTMRHDPSATFVQARADDERVTSIGRWLRRTSLDELPQLLNVLRGDMSLVGPRPHQIVLNAAFTHLRRFATRHRVKPGITGLAQVYGWRGATDTEEKMAGRISHDLYYIENWSLLLDLKILALTVLTGFGRKNAY
jgi:Undecaprenyl-phosphate glucose phosphotransferase